MARRSSRFAGVFEPFIEETLERFAYLVRDFGFEQSETSVVSYECVVRYRKAGSVLVEVYCEAGGLPWVMLTARYRPRPGRPYRLKEAALDYVIDVRCPERRLDLGTDPFPAPAAAVSDVLRQNAVALRECAADFLGGDPSVVIQVQPAVDAAYSQALAEERRASAASRRKKKRAAAKKGRGK